MLHPGSHSPSHFSLSFTPASHASILRDLTLPPEFLLVLTNSLTVPSSDRPPPPHHPNQQILSFLWLQSALALILQSSCWQSPLSTRYFSSPYFWNIQSISHWIVCYSGLPDLSSVAFKQCEPLGHRSCAISSPVPIASGPEPDIYSKTDDWMNKCKEKLTIFCNLI